MALWLDEDGLEGLIVKKDHISFNSDPPPPLRFKEELMPHSQYSDSSDVEDEGPRRPDYNHIMKTLRQVEDESSDHLTTLDKHETGDETKNFEIILTKTFLNPHVSEFVPRAMPTSEAPAEETKAKIAKLIEEGKNADSKNENLAQAVTKEPRQRNTAMESLLKLRALYGNSGGPHLPSLQLLRPEDILLPPPPVALVSEPLVALPKPTVSFAGCSDSLRLAASSESMNVCDKAEEKVARWFDGKKTPESPKHRAREVNLSKELVFVPKMSPAASGSGSPSPAAPVPQLASGNASPSPAAPAPQLASGSAFPGTAAPAPGAAARGPTQFVASANASALYEKYNRKNRAKRLAPPTGVLESHLQNTLWARVSEKLTEAEIKKNAMTDLD